MLVHQAGFGEVVAIGFLLISFIGWINNLISAQNPPPPPKRAGGRPQPPPRPRDVKVQSEIEAFLREAVERRGQGPAAGKAGGPLPVPRPASSVPTAQGQQPASAAAASQSAASVRPGGAIAARSLEKPSGLGTGVASHVRTHMGERISREVSQHLPHAINQGVGHHLGQFTAGQSDPRADVVPVVQSHASVSDPTRLIDQLREQDGMRKAIILNTILSRPRVLQKSRH
jgi:hypothetical protein